MNWLAKSRRLERFSLEGFSREISLYRHAGDDLSAIEMVKRALKRGFAVAAIVSALVGAGYSVNYAHKMVEDARQTEEIFPYNEELPFRTMDIPVGEPVNEANPIEEDGNELANVPEVGRPDMDRIYEYISNNEGVRDRRVYRDSYGHPTIGIGHLLGRRSEALFHSLFGDRVDFNRILDGTDELTDEEVRQLFESDIASRISTAKNMFPRFNSYGSDLQAAIMDGIYRGDLLGSPKTRRLMNAGEWEKAADEYLNHREYRRAKKAYDDFKSGKSERRPNNVGIIRRMEHNADIIREGI